MSVLLINACSVNILKEYSFPVSCNCTFNGWTILKTPKSTRGMEIMLINAYFGYKIVLPWFLCDVILICFCVMPFLYVSVWCNSYLFLYNNILRWSVWAILICFCVTSFLSVTRDFMASYLKKWTRTYSICRTNH